MSSSNKITTRRIATGQNPFLSPGPLGLEEIAGSFPIAPKSSARVPDLIQPNSRRDNLRVAMIASYPPQKCGIASFTSDLRDALLRFREDMIVDIIAVAESPEEIEYPDEVVCRIEKHNWESYSDCAEYLNRKKYDLVCLQHEFGLFGGPEGAYIVDLLRRLHIPVVTTLHTLLANPSPEYHTRTRELLQASDVAVTLTSCGLNLMRHVYDMPTFHNARVIPHGIPDIPFTMPEEHKKDFGWEDRKVLMTFGLIGPSKGLEVMIDALPAIVENHPDLLYVIAGATHPGVLAHQGESYRDGLKEQIARLGVEKNVCFINRYIDNEELCRYLQACDVYVTPYRNRDQISSGTLSYAFGAGRALVSTPYWYAVDLLSSGRGALVDFESPNSLAEAVNGLFNDEKKRRKMYRRAYEYSRAMTWGVVAEGYHDVMTSLVSRPSSRAIQSMVAGSSLVTMPMIYRSR